MRKLFARLILWIASRMGLVLLDETRIPMGSDVKARAERWDAFCREEGGLYDMIESERLKAFEAYSALPPSAHDDRNYLAMTDRNWRTLKARVQAVVTSGKIEERNEARKAHKPILKSV